MKIRIMKKNGLQHTPLLSEQLFRLLRSKSKGGGMRLDKYLKLTRTY